MARKNNKNTENATVVNNAVVEQAAPTVDAVNNTAAADAIAEAVQEAELNAQLQAEQQEADKDIDVMTPVKEDAAPMAVTTAEDAAAKLNALFAAAGLSTATSKQRDEEYANAVLKTNDGQNINQQHQNWSDTYQAQRIAAVKLGQYRTQVLGLPAGCRKFSKGKFRTTQVWEEAKKMLTEEQLTTYLAMEKAIEDLA